MNTSTAVKSDVKVTSLPLPILLAPPTVGEVLADMTPDALLESEGARYNAELQITETPGGLPLIEAFSTKCSGICGTNVGGFIISERDQVKDD